MGENNIMKLSSILLQIIGKMHGERSKNAALYILRGKKSGQTLSDVKYFNLKPYFSILPKVEVDEYEEAIHLLQKEHLIEIKDQLVFITEIGFEQLQQLPSTHFKGWSYRGKELLFFRRLSLVVQTVSNIKNGNRSFLPIESDRTIQIFVKRFFMNRPLADPEFARQIGKELIKAIVQSGMSEEQKLIFAYRLTGYKNAAMTYDQLSIELKRSPSSIRLLFLESLHRLLPIVEHKKEFPIMSSIAADIRIVEDLTESATATKQLYLQGLTMEEIAAKRNLKLSTIEDHFVEMAIHDERFPIHSFVTERDVQAVRLKMKELQTKRLRVLKDEFQALSYFQLRLILSINTGGQDD